MAITVHGIPNCDQIKKTLAWFKAAGIAVEFHDYKLAGIDAATLARWSDAVGWERLLNRAGTTWRKLPDDVRESVTSAKRALALLAEHPSLIKRPVVTRGAQVLVGYDPAAFEALTK